MKIRSTSLKYGSIWLKSQVPAPQHTWSFPRMCITPSGSWHSMTWVWVNPALHPDSTEPIPHVSYTSKKIECLRIFKHPCIFYESKFDCDSHRAWHESIRCWSHWNVTWQHDNNLEGKTLMIWFYSVEYNPKNKGFKWWASQQCYWRTIFGSLENLSVLNQISFFRVNKIFFFLLQKTFVHRKGSMDVLPRNHRSQ